jgi:hypothetical protein
MKAAVFFAKHTLGMETEEQAVQCVDHAMRKTGARREDIQVTVIPFMKCLVVEASAFVVREMCEYKTATGYILLDKAVA